MIVPNCLRVDPDGPVAAGRLEFSGLGEEIYMSIQAVKLAIPVWVFLIVGMVGYPVLGGHEKIGPGEADAARDKAALIALDQMNLRDATDMAEKAVSGTALQVSCEIQPGLGMPTEGKDLQADSTVGQSHASRRLVYQVCCFAKEKLQTVRIDGLTKKVIDVREHK